MKMNYRRTSSQGRQRRGPAAAFAAALAAAILFFHFALPGFVGGVLRFAASPIWAGQQYVGSGLSGILAGFSSKASLSRDNDALRAENQLLRAEQSNAALLSADNDRLRGLLGMRASRPATVSAVVRRPPQAPFDSFLIDAGQDKNVQKDDLVYADGSVILGKVGEVYGSSAQVLLFSAPQVSTLVRLGAHPFEAQLVGRGGGNFEMKLPRSVAAAEGDAVTLPDAAHSIVGIVGAVIADPNDSFQRVLVSTPTNIQATQEVLVVKAGVAGK